jgi:coenzyme PQQ precursor peptide PqqA
MGNRTTVAARPGPPTPKAHDRDRAKRDASRRWERPAFEVVELGCEVTAYAHQR